LREDKKIDIELLQQNEHCSKAHKNVVSAEFVEVHMPMVESLAAMVNKKVGLPSCIEFSDLVSWGVEGLIQARETFNADKGAQFKTYAYIRIRGKIMDKLRVEWNYKNPNQYKKYRQRIRDKIKDSAEGIMTYSEDRDSKRLIQKMLDHTMMTYMLSIDTFVDVASNQQDAQNPEIKYVDQSDGLLWDEVKNLTEEEKNIIELFYVHGLKQNQISEKLNYSKSKVCRLHSQILLKLKRKLHGKY
jgi:RNA polymerase sigma factor for flagellar operon FliA